MRMLLTIILGVVSGVSGMAQGTVVFSNFGGSGVLDAPIYDAFGSGGLDSNYSVELYYAAGTVTSSYDLSVLPGSSTPILESGYFLGGEKMLPDIPGGSTATLQVRAWRASDGPSWAAAYNNTGAWVGAGNLITVTLGGFGSPPSSGAAMIGLTSFTVPQLVPEPSSIAIGVLAAGCLVFGLRRRQFLQ